MPPRGKKQTAPPTAPAPVEYKTIGDKCRAIDAQENPLQAAYDAKGFNGLNANEKLQWGFYQLLNTGLYQSWPAKQQDDLFKAIEKYKVPFKLPSTVPQGIDRRGRPLADYTVPEYEQYEKEQEHLSLLKDYSKEFRQRWKKQKYKVAEQPSDYEFIGIKDRTARITLGVENEDIDFKKLDYELGRPLYAADLKEERERRAEVYNIETGKKMGKYENDPTWDDVCPIPQDDGDNPLAAIAYSDEYAEVIAYLRAVMADEEYSQRCLDLTAHLIDLNPAHYTVWLYRAAIIFAIRHSIGEELEWVNEIALANQKNYQIWHHRQLLIDKLYPTICSSRSAVLRLAKSEIDFLTQMFAQDSKNYHVWSYRQYVVRKLGLFPSQCDDPSEIASLEALIDDDVRNNSAWSHRFFVVFSDPGNSTPDYRTVEYDEKVPANIVDREIKFAEDAVWLAPQNQSPWNYIRGVLRKAGRELATEESFAIQFVEDLVGGDEKVKSTHALDLLAEIWAAKGEKEKAAKALALLGDKYDPVRKNYWEWRGAQTAAALA